MCLLGGAWPLEGIVPWYRIVSYLTPVTIPLEGIRSVVNRGWGLEHPVVRNGCLVSLGWIFSCFTLSIIFHKINKN